MSLKIEGCSCARCKAYLFSEDDIVYCPVCGAPHHRECYNALGHCALEELHGTENEYSMEKELEALQKSQEKTEEKTQAKTKLSKTICNMCGTEYEVGLGKCPNCSAPNFSSFSGVYGFDFLGGVPADYKLDENVTADDAKKFVIANTHRYIPKFATLTKKNKISWNWMAFFFPSQWMFSRKMFKNGILIGILYLTVTLLTLPFALEINNLAMSEVANSMELVVRIAEMIPEMSKAVVILQLVAFVGELLLRVLCAMFGDYMYRDYTLSTIKKIKAESDDIAFEYRKRGGVNIFWFLLSTLALQYLPSILLTII